MTIDAENKFTYRYEWCPHEGEWLGIVDWGDFHRTRKMTSARYMTQFVNDCVAELTRELREENQILKEKLRILQDQYKDDMK